MLVKTMKHVVILMDPGPAVLYGKEYAALKLILA